MSGVKTKDKIRIGLGIAGVAVVISALTYSPGLVKWTLTPAALTIADRFYPVTVRAADVDVASARVVDIANDAEWRPAAKVNGYANSHYRAGWFMTAGRHRVRMYRTDGTRLVLLTPKGDGTPVLMQVAQPDEFLVQLRREWR